MMISSRAGLEKLEIEQVREKLRKRADIRDMKPTVKEVTIIVDDLLAVIPLAETAKKMGRATVKENESMVLDVIATFGTWITHSMGAADVTVTWARNNTQLALLQTADRNKPVKRTRKKNPLAVVIGPVGYEPEAKHKRNIERALASIVATHPSEEVIARFVARTYTTRSARLTFPLVSGVWGFTVRGRLADIDRVSDDALFLQQVVDAYDLLEIARIDAMESIVFLAEGEVTDLELVREAILKAHWLAETEMNQLSKLAVSAGTSKDGLRLLKTELRFLKQRMLKNPSRYKAECVGDLLMGQVRKIGSTAGLLPSSDARATEAAIRAQLKALGLQTDADRLVPEALRASERGQLDDFWDIIQSRLDGDATWFTQLSELGAV